MHRPGPESDYVSYSERDSHPLLHEDVEKHLPNVRRNQASRGRTAWIGEQLRSTLFAVLRHSLVSLLLLLAVVVLAPGVLLQMIRGLSLDNTVVPLKNFPLASKLRWENIPGDVDYWSERIYMGEPSKESEIAWNHLLSGAFKVTDEEAPGLNLTVGLPLEHGGYGALLGVDHNLHCLRHFRQMFYFDHYWANKTTPAEVQWLKEHTVHCLEAMRKSMMCVPDLSTHPHFASGNPFHPINAGPWDNKECVDWDALQRLTKERRFPRSEYGVEIEEAMRAANHRMHGVTHAVHANSSREG